MSAVKLPSSALIRSLVAMCALGAGVVLAGAGPAPEHDKRGRAVSFGHEGPRVSISIDHIFGRRPIIHRPAHQTPPPPVRYDVAPADLAIEALQAGDTVIVRVSGTNPTAGYSTTLRRSRWGGAHGAGLTLINLTPEHCGPVAQQCTPFSLAASFESRRPLREITIRVGNSERCVPVQCITPLRERDDDCE
jgi:hypothetical protein